MRVAICSVGELFGGVERQILGFSEFLAEENLGPALVALFHDAELARQLRAHGIEPVILKGRHRYDPGTITQLTRLLRERKIDVVHAHGYKATIACGLAKRSVPFRLIKTEHGKLEGTPRRPIGWLKGQVNFNLEQFVTRRTVDEICYVTADIASHFARYHRGTARRIIANGITPLTANGRERPDDLPPGCFNVGIVGRVSRVKGIDFVLQALAEHDFPETLRLVVIGTGPLLSQLQAEVSERGLGERVQLLGFRENIYDYLAHLDVLLMPSYHEGLPYTLLEAMSLARPIAASRVGGLAEVLTDDRTGLLFSVGDTAGIAGALRRLVDHPALCRRLGEAAQKEQRERYDLATMGHSYLEVYRGAGSA